MTYLLNTSERICMLGSTEGTTPNPGHCLAGDRPKTTGHLVGGRVRALPRHVPCMLFSTFVKAAISGKGTSLPKVVTSALSDLGTENKRKRGRRMMRSEKSRLYDYALHT
jgi:hypothetical protein